MIHEDERRILMSMPYKTGETKTIIAKQDCLLGNHYHKIKTEHFILIEGDATAYIDNELINLKENSKVKVKPNQLHSFKLKKDSVLFCVCSHPYNPKDDYEY